MVLAVPRRCAIDIKSGVELATEVFEAAGALALVVGTIIAAVPFVVALLGGATLTTALVPLRQNIGRAILLSLELLVAADILRSVAISPTFESVGVLGLLVLVRTFLSWSLQVEIEGAWPWQQVRGSRAKPPGSAPQGDATPTREG
jgi:uncharacterized membrane protein